MMKRFEERKKQHFSVTTRNFRSSSDSDVPLQCESCVLLRFFLEICSSQPSVGLYLLIFTDALVNRSFYIFFLGGLFPLTEHARA